MQSPASTAPPRRAASPARRSNCSSISPRSRAGWTPDSLIDDEPITVGGWSPANVDGVYRGKITLREAFQRSSNAATVRLAEKVGRGNVMRAARDLGITTSLPDEPSLALGTAGVSLLELTSAYAAIASGRYPVIARGLPEDPTPAGSRLVPARRTLDRQRDWAPMLDLLYAAANKGTGRRAALSVPTFGKTGTTQDNRDALFIGFAGNLVVGVWVGRDDDKSLGKVTGGTVPARHLAALHDLGARRSTGRRGPDFRSEFNRRTRKASDEHLKSPLPPAWSDATKRIRDFAEELGLIEIATDLPDALRARKHCD